MNDFYTHCARCGKAILQCYCVHGPSITNVHTSFMDKDVDPSNEYEQLGHRLGALVDSKQRQYGNSVEKSAKMLSVLYPDGLQPHQYDDALLVVRILDKLSRIAQRGESGKDLGGESPWEDIGGYALLGWQKDKK